MGNINNRYKNISAAISACDSQPTVIQMQRVIEVVHTDFFITAKEADLIAALKRISADSEEHPEVKNIADAAIAAAVAQPDYLPNISQDGSQC